MLAVSAVVAIAVVGLARAPRVGETDLVDPPNLAEALPRDAELVDRFLGALRGAGGLSYRATPASGAPGLVGGGPAPALGEFLDWSGIVYRIDRGACSVDEAGADLRVVCPAARWSGPLLDGLTLAPVVQPTTFVVHGATVTAMEGGTAPALAASFQNFCDWVRRARPETAAVVFSDGCRPVFGEDAARALLVVLSGYADDPR